jgi:hypothetical protein
MALWICGSCTAAYAVGLAACPQCGATEYEEDYTMAKITSAGASYEPGKDPNEPDAEPVEPGAETEPADAPADGSPADPDPGPAETEPAPAPAPAKTKP